MTVLLEQLTALLKSEKNSIANAANTASLLFNNLDNVNWVGFYCVTDFNNASELVLGPFCGQPACTRIQIGKGVCGAAYAQQQTIVVDDVHQFADHIVCDIASQSEIVVPFVSEERSLAGVLDIDSPIKNRFTQADREFFEKVVDIYIKSSFN